MSNHRPMPQRGAATLVVVMLLLFAMVLVAGYGSRHLLGEQQTSATQYRQTQAFEAAEAGLEWTAAMLNAGRIDAHCRPSSDPAHDTFRERYLVADTGSGRFAVVANAATLVDDAGRTDPTVRPGCVIDATGWTCRCPAAGQTGLVAGGAATAFTVELQGGAQPGVVGVRVRACTQLGGVCIHGHGGRSDAQAEATALLALAGGPRTPPAAALTARGRVDTGVSTLAVVNTDPHSRGITIDAGGTVDTPAARLVSVAGTPAETSVAADDLALRQKSADQLFASLFGIDKATYRRQPAVARLRCGGDCAAALRSAHAAGTRLVWLDENLVLDAAAVVGTPHAPLAVVVDGDVRLDGGAVLHGLVYATGATWQLGATGAAWLRGAAVAEGDFNGSGSGHVVHDPEILARLARGAGSFVRVPGSWSDHR